MADPQTTQTNTVPVPQGATLGAPIPATPTAVPVPQGATLGAPIAAMSDTDVNEAAKTGAVDAVGNMGIIPGGQAGLGAAKSVAEGLLGIGRNIPGVKNLLPEKEPEFLKSSNAEQTGGKLVENAAEWIGGEEGLKALSEVAQAGKFMKNAAMWQHFVQNSPNAAKAVKALGRIAESAGIGGVQGGVHGAADNNAVEGALGGTVGGAIGGVAAEAVTSVAAPAIAKVLGMNREPVDEMMKVIKPGKWDDKFAPNFLAAADRLNESLKVKPWKNIEDVADAALDQKNDLWNGEIHDAIDRHKTEPLDVSSIAQDLRAKAQNPTMMLHSPEGSAELEKEAQIFDKMNGLKVGDVEETLEHINAKLTSEKWWKQSGAERAAAAKVGDPLAVLDDAARGIREKLYDHLEQNGEPEIRNLKKEYGALASVEHYARGQVNVSGRQVPLSLKDMVALAGMAAAGPKGWMLGAVPLIDKIVNNPARMASRAVSNAVGEEPLLMKVGRATAPVLRSGAGLVGSEAGQEAANPETTE